MLERARRNRRPARIAGMAETVVIRRGNLEDVEACGRILYDAFADIAGRHNFPKDFPSVEFATRRIGSLITHPGIYPVVAERTGRIAGSNFLDERSTIVGI